MSLTKNYRFNRVEYEGGHHYLIDLEERNLGSAKYEGIIKCKLAHMEDGSVIVPDQLYLERKSDLRWIQPLFFTANHLVKDENNIVCRLYIDISFGEVLEVEFSKESFIRSLPDGSELYECKIRGTRRLWRHFTGSAEWGHDGDIWMRLFHHTKSETAELISESGYLKGSEWNIQGNKKLENVEYVYFTSLNKIKNEDDLVQIAMSSDGQIHLRVDQNNTQNPDLTLQVYRGDTKNRRHSMTFWVKSSSLAPQPIYLHHPVSSSSFYYQIVGPFIHRVGVSPDTVLDIYEDEVEARELKRFEYMIMGDASTVEGLRAPYDEENTDSIFKIEEVSEGNMLKFWFENSNQDHFSGKHPEFQQFSRED
jgi:hypothetical protein